MVLSAPGIEIEYNSHYASPSRWNDGVVEVARLDTIQRRNLLQEIISHGRNEELESSVGSVLGERTARELASDLLVAGNGRSNRPRGRIRRESDFIIDVQHPNEQTANLWDDILGEIRAEGAHDEGDVSERARGYSTADNGRDYRFETDPAVDTSLTTANLMEEVLSATRDRRGTLDEAAATHAAHSPFERLLADIRSTRRHLERVGGTDANNEGPQTSSGQRRFPFSGRLQLALRSYERVSNIFAPRRRQSAGAPATASRRRSQEEQNTAESNETPADWPERWRHHPAGTHVELMAEIVARRGGSQTPVESQSQEERAFRLNTDWPEHWRRHPFDAHVEMMAEIVARRGRSQTPVDSQSQEERAFRRNTIDPGAAAISMRESLRRHSAAMCMSLSQELVLDEASKDDSNVKAALTLSVQSAWSRQDLMHSSPVATGVSAAIVQKP
eukprot:CAMPEP_0113555966 /NCGR_PEP_ID=MMETSP0015_2-20120614/17004_1 /TAXON_ID=2838 /ORGANISM="Odontella" /LENGTH=445 /DNA_ID=CAMNT_0000457289 /DNA_START=70 /DNA_END=1408 /DNA_ORIENTATION=+ /assembly_acc=CAM_ASM_000160